jgi:hypothetical protein
MSDEEYLRCKFSITLQTNDLAVVHCLRSLCEYAEEVVKTQIGWGGTKRGDWENAGNKITLRFSDPRFRGGRATLGSLGPSFIRAARRPGRKSPAHEEKGVCLFSTTAPDPRSCRRHRHHATTLVVD